MEMEIRNPAQDYKIKNNVITVESIYSKENTIKELIKEYILHMNSDHSTT